MDKFADVSDLTGVQVHLNAAEGLTVSLRNALELTTAMPARGSGIESRNLTIARTASLQAVNALIGALQAKCNLALPPEDIEAGQDAQGDLIYCCFHVPQHRWSLSGQKLP